MTLHTDTDPGSQDSPVGPPTGLIGMLFTDIEGSTRMAASLGDEWPAVLDGYHSVVGGVARARGGWVDGTAGDGSFITFGDVAQAGRAAVDIQRALRTYAWPSGVEVRVRMGLHVGQVERSSHGYVGLEIHRAARLGASAHGGQLLLSGAAAELLRDVVPSQPLGAHRLKDFPAPTALFCAVIDGKGAGAFPPPRTLELRAGNLPVGSLGLIGRESDLARVRHALLDETERLVTLLGRGGVGKTSLALAAGHDLLELHPGGVWWIDASQERDAAGLLKAIARGCRIDAAGTLHEAVIADLASRGALLLILDNLEQIAGAGDALDTLLVRLPDVAVLATSQLPLRCRSERRLQLDRLDEPAALALLERTMERLDIPPDLDPTAAAELVRVLDGLPLAIELAAGRLRLFSPTELVARLRTSTAILQDRSRPDRQRSLSTALDWTLDLLDPDARELFTRLGVFVGPVELEDIEEVLGSDGLDVIGAVETLINAALLQRVEVGDGFVRFGFPEAIRQEAAQRLDARDAADGWRRAHAVWVRDRIWPLRIYEIADPRRVEQAHAAAAETRVAIARVWARDRPLGREIALGRFALASRAGALAEARDLIDRVLADPGDDPAVVDLVRVHAVFVARAEASENGDYAGPLVELFPELRDPYARFLCAQNAGIALTWDGRFDDALAWLDRARALAREIGPRAETNVLVIAADTLLEAGRYDEASVTLAESDALAAAARVADRLVETEVIRAAVQSWAGAHVDALDRLARALTEAELAGDLNALWMIIVALVRALARAGREAAMLGAAGVAQAIAAEREAEGDHVPDVFANPERAVAAALARSGDRAQAILNAGRALDPSQRVKRLCALIYSEESRSA